MPRKLQRAYTAAARWTGAATRAAPYATALGSVLIIWYAAHDRPAPPEAMAAERIAPNPIARAAARAAAADVPQADVPVADRPSAATQAGAASTISVVVGQNDTMDAIFRRAALDTADLAAIRKLPGMRQNLDFLRPGDAIKVTRSRDGAMKELSRKISDTQTLRVIREEAGFAAKIVSHPVELRIRSAAATIDSSLFQAAEAADISDAVALKLANVFAWDIDFVLDIRPGDRFTAVYQQIYQDGSYLRDGEVLAAEFINGGKVYRALRFTPDGGPAAYYTPDGKPMRKAFLRAPVDFTRVSSVFNPTRRHPILNMIRGHMGTDYAAPTGTPVRAAGDGRVSFEGLRGGYGKALVLAHSDSVSTLYGHLSRFAPHIRAGSHVTQGQVIGYVGMTGLATGPHLHYEYLLNGVHMNPQTVRLPGAEPLRAGALLKFRAAAAPMLTALSVQSSPAPVEADRAPNSASTGTAPNAGNREAETSLN